MSPIPILSHPAWNAAGWTMLHLVWIGAVGSLGVALLRRLLRPANPEVRHGIAVACLLALAGSPIVLFANLYRPRPVTPTLIGRVVPMSTTTGSAISVSDGPKDREQDQSGPGPIAAPPSPALSRFEPLVGYLPGVWLIGSLGTLMLIATGLFGVERLRRTSRPLDDGEIACRSRVLAARLGIVRRVGVAICDRIAMPVLIGVARPMILLPPAALAGWAVEEVEMALLHELAHIRRHDNVVIILQRLAEALLFFHPVAWWLSAWVSLERELCCDRLVVDHTGRPQDYARMLAALGGVTSGTPTMALAMAERPLTARIRRILDMEDRSMMMRLTMAEGLGLLAAMVTGAAFALAAHAGPTHPVAQGEARRILERMAQGIATMPDHQERYESKGCSLLNVARAQLKLGDRAAALATLHLLDGLAEPSANPGTKIDPRRLKQFGVLVESAEVRREAGDPEGARIILDRATRNLNLPDIKPFREAVERVYQEVDTAFRKDPEGIHRLNDEEAAMICEASLYLVDQWILLGDKARARDWISRLADGIGPPQGFAKGLYAGFFGRCLIKAGDPEGGRKLIDQSRRVILELPEGKMRSFALSRLAWTLADAGEIDEALAMIRRMPPLTQQEALSEILGGYATTDHNRVAWFDPSGIAIKIGQPSLGVKDAAAARAALPKIANAAMASNDARVQARTLAIVVHLQARAGDTAGALATARSIPDLKRSDYPGPSDGFYDAVKPVAIALIAGVQAENGDRTVATVTLGEAESLARSIASPDQRLIAQIAIAQKWTACGRPDAAKAVVAEELPLALSQPEPRRSRVLAMFADAQTQAGDPAGALSTIDAIREYPGLEKARALSMVSRRYEDSGDATAATAARCRMVACLEARAPEAPLPGKVMNLEAIGRDTFIDYDLELHPGMIKFQREGMLRSALTNLGDFDAVIRAIRALPPERRALAESQVVSDLTHRGEVARALDFAASIGSPEARLIAFDALAWGIPDSQARK